MADREKRGKIKIQKCEYHENKKSFSHEINSALFIINSGLSFGEKMKNRGQKF